MSRLAALALVFALELAPTAATIRPARFVPDPELATRPVIVVGRWKGAPFEDRGRVEGDVLRQWEMGTEVEIERVIAGDVKPGTHAILLGYAVGWPQKGGRIVSTMSTEQDGDASEVCDSNLWFFSRTRSWKTEDKTDYLHLDTFRGVQPLVLEKYFEALRAKEPHVEVPKLPDSPDPVVVLRVLEYVCGGQLPWPYEPWDFVRPKKDKKAPLAACAPRVAELLDPRRPAEIRRSALAAYADVARERGFERLREALGDTDVRLRLIAATLLAARKDKLRIDAMCDAMKAGAELKDRYWHDTRILCDFVARCEAWGEPALVPALIALLQVDGGGWASAEMVPALRAQRALQTRTGVSFPLDVDAARAAWTRTKDVERLAEAFAPSRTILTARITNARRDHRIVVTNGGGREVVLLRQPTSGEIRYRSEGSSGSGGLGKNESIGKADFVTLAPGASHTFALEREDDDLMKSFLEAPPASRSIELRYLRNGHALGLNAWMGTIDVTFGEGWTEPPREK